MSAMANESTGVDWRDLGQQVREETEARFQKEMDLAEKLVNHLLDGLRSLQEPNADRPVQRLVRLLVIRAVHSLNAAFDLAFHGHYPEAASLTRTAYECWLAGAYVCCIPSEGPRLARRGTTWPQPACMRQLVAAHLSKDSQESSLLRDALGKMYSKLCKLVHVSFSSLASALDDKGGLQYGPFLSSQRLLICTDFAYRTSTLLNCLLEQAFPSLGGTGWSESNTDLARQVNDWARQASP